MKTLQNLIFALKENTPSLISFIITFRLKTQKIKQEQKIEKALFNILGDEIFVLKSFIFFSVTNSSIDLIDSRFIVSRQENRITSRLKQWLIGHNALKRLIEKHKFGFLCYTNFFKIDSSFSYISKFNFNISSKDDVLAIHFDNLPVGDLIYDTYLRFSSQATVDISDPFLFEIINRAELIYLYGLKVFSENNYSTYVTTYTSYIYFGILTRIATNKNIKVVTLAVPNQLYRVIYPSFTGHTRDYLRYKDDFKNLKVTDHDLEVGKILLEGRLSGINDPSTFYMKQSAYSNESSEILLDRPSIIVMSHCFFDSPHIYKSMNFSDFYEWLIFIGSQTRECPFDVYIKPHPNGLKGNETILREIVFLYPHFKLLSPNISNKSILKAGFKFAITNYGTCAHEFSYCGLPVISCSDNPHSNYSFSNTLHSRDELIPYLKGDKYLTSDVAKREILEFFYMHNLALTGDRTLSDLQFNSLFRHHEPVELYRIVADSKNLNHILKSYRSDMQQDKTYG